MGPPMGQQGNPMVAAQSNGGGGAKWHIPQASQPSNGELVL